jgi:hypothetical protein
MVLSYGFGILLFLISDLRNQNVFQVRADVLETIFQGDCRANVLLALACLVCQFLDYDTVQYFSVLPFVVQLVRDYIYVELFHQDVFCFFSCDDLFKNNTMK